MSYDVRLYMIQTMHNEKQSSDDEFFDHDSNLVLFTGQQYLELTERLIRYDYQPIQFDQDTKHFKRQDTSAQAYLTKQGLYFSCSFNDEDIFEIRMTVSEFTDTGEYAKYDPQIGEWEV